MDAELQKLAAYIKVSDSMQKGLESDDFIKNQLTAMLYGHVVEMAKESGEVTVYIEPPSFFDWLLRRWKVKKVPYTISQLMKIDNLVFPDNIRIIKFE